jgi:hypothetical protein
VKLVVVVQNGIKVPALELSVDKQTNKQTSMRVIDLGSDLECGRG